MGERHLTTLYGSLAALACLAAVQAIAFPRWPRVGEPLPATEIQTALERAGLSPAPLPSLPAVRSYDRARSAVIGFRLGDGTELRLMEGSVRERLNFQSAFLSRDNPHQELARRSLPEREPPTASGLVGGKPGLETCLVPGSPASLPFGVTRDQLTALADSSSRGDTLATLARVLGLRENRSYRCVLISLRSPRADSRIPPERWQRVLQALRTPLEESRSPLPAGNGSS